MSEFATVKFQDKKYRIPKKLATGVDKLINSKKTDKEDAEETMFEWQTGKGKKNMKKSPELSERLDEVEEEMDSIEEEMEKKDMGEKPNQFGGNKTKLDPGHHGKKKDMDKEKEDMDEEHEDEDEKKEDEAGEGGSLKKENLNKKPQSTVDSMVAKAIVDAQDVLSACQDVFTPGEMEIINRKDSFGRKKAFIKKVSPSLHSSVKFSTDRNFVDGVFKALKSSRKSENKLDSALIQLGSTYPSGNKVDNKEVQKIDGTDLILARNSSEAVMNESRHWMFDSPAEYVKACKKVRIALMDDEAQNYVNF